MNSHATLLLISIVLLASNPAFAANAKFQDFFFALCSNPSGQLAARCNETTDGLGDLSGDSESSLNPSQTLGTLAGSRNSAEQRNAAGQTVEPTVKAFELELGPFSLLVNGRFSTEELDRDVDTDADRSYELENYGVQAGLDYRLSPNVVVGALLLWETSKLEFARDNPGRNFTPIGRSGKVDSDSYGLALFVNREWSSGYFANATLTYLDSSFDYERRALFQESNRVEPATYVTTQASGDGQSVSLNANLERTLQYGNWSLSPFVGLSYLNLDVDGYRERDLSNSGLAMQVRGERSSKLDSQLGLRTSAVISGDAFIWIPHLRLQATHSINVDRPDSTITFTQDAAQRAFQLQGDRPDRSYVDVGLGSALIFPNGVSAFMELQTTLGRKDFDAYSLRAGIRLEL